MWPNKCSQLEHGIKAIEQMPCSIQDNWGTKSRLTQQIRLQNVGCGPAHLWAKLENQIFLGLSQNFDLNKKGEQPHEVWFFGPCARKKISAAALAGLLKKETRKITGRSWLEGDSNPDWDKILHTRSSHQSLLIYWSRF